MKKLIPIFVAAMLLLTMVPAFAAETVPSIEQKGTPTLVSASDESIELVPLFEAEQTDELRQAYAAIQTVSLGENIVIRDLFNVVGNVESGTITLDLSTYGPRDQIVILEYRDNEWKQIPTDRIVFNEDGTVTVVLDELCPLAVAQGVIDEGEGEGCPFILCRIFDTDIACNHTHCLEFNHHCFCWTWWLLLIIIILTICYRIYKRIKKLTEKDEEKENE